MKTRITLMVAAGCLAAPSVTLSAGTGRVFHETYLGTGNDLNGTSSTAVADFDGDGNADLAVPVTDLGQVLVYSGNGRGRFGPPAAYMAGAAANNIVTGDFNGDGHPDLVLGDDRSGSIGLEVLLNDGKGGFNAPAVIPLDAGYFDQIVPGDFNRDGKLDLVLSLPLIPGGPSLYGTVVVLGDGQGGFGGRIVSAGSGGPLAVADFNGDGILDIAVAGMAALQVSLGNGGGSFTAVSGFQLGGQAGGVATADLNHDGHVDIAVAEGSLTDRMDTYLGNGSGDFAVSNIVPSYGIHGLVAADLNGDGNADLATADVFTNRVSIAKGNGLGGFGAAQAFPLLVPVNPAPVDLTAGDFNGDGRPDLVTADHGTGGATVLLSRPR